MGMTRQRARPQTCRVLVSTVSSSSFTWVLQVWVRGLGREDWKDRQGPKMEVPMGIPRNLDFALKVSKGSPLKSFLQHGLSHFFKYMT